jgi:hypothetical protein
MGGPAQGPPGIHRRNGLSTASAGPAHLGPSRLYAGIAPARTRVSPCFSPELNASVAESIKYLDVDREFAEQRT